MLAAHVAASCITPPTRAFIVLALAAAALADYP
jgi:hypothetical protein